MTLGIAVKQEMNKMNVINLPYMARFLDPGFWHETHDSVKNSLKLVFKRKNISSVWCYMRFIWLQPHGKKCCVWKAGCPEITVSSFLPKQ